MALADSEPDTLAFRTDAHARRLIVRESPTEDLALGWQIERRRARSTPFSAGSRRARSKSKRSAATRRRCAGSNASGGSSGRRVRRSNSSSSRGRRRPLKVLVSGFVTGERGMGHVAITTRKPDAMIAFWREIFDAKISDFIEDRIGGVDLSSPF